MPTAPNRTTRPQRPPSSKRGYGYRWSQYSKRRLARHPFCVQCETAGRTTAAACTDHIIPVTGPDDPLFWPETNHQSLCWSCHSRKTATETNGGNRPS